jgi:hypothetical protein
MKQAIVAISAAIAARMTGFLPRWSETRPVMSSASKSASAQSAKTAVSVSDERCQRAA